MGFFHFEAQKFEDNFGTAFALGTGAEPGHSE
jgi:hypothetical protein